MAKAKERYLTPYVIAADQFGGSFKALLWASPHTQALRFDAIARAINLHNRVVIDAGCGRADLLDHLMARGIRPAQYIGIEAVEALAESAEQKHHEQSTILRADFVKSPEHFNLGADVILFSGSLNTLDNAEFYETIRLAFDSALHAVVFNFLSSPALAGKEYLTWHRLSDVQRFGKKLARRVTVSEQYLDGDCTMVIWKSNAE